MKLGKIIFVSMLLLVIFAMGAVSASDANETITATDDDNLLESANGFEDNLEINEANDVLKETPKTFSQLNATINGNKDSEIYLDSNYTFESDTDNKFKEGVIIDRAVTVYGNGYTLNGNNAARFFQVTNSNVTFKNIFFVNGNATDYNNRHGGAINGKCTAINCTFNSNYASGYGGAMYNGSAVNCTFVNNSASYGGAMFDGSAVNCTFNSNFVRGYYCSGGAMHGGSAVKCIFVNNSASVGGAIVGVSVVDSTFNSNHASDNGGAMTGGSAWNCTFISNFVRGDSGYGGAVNGGGAYNCTFISNFVIGDSGYAGAMGAGLAYNCTFISNFVIGDSGHGGAMCGPAENCIFINNTAYNGGAISMGSAWNCIFVNNSASNGGAAYGNHVKNCIFNYNTAFNGGAISDGVAENCTFNYNHAKNYGGAMHTIYSRKEGVCSVWIEAINCIFNYNTASSGGAVYGVPTVNCTFNQEIIDPKIAASNVKVVYAAGSYYTIKVYGTDGKLADGATVKITGKISKTLTTTNGIAKFKVTQLPGTYKIKITALGKSVIKTITVKHLVTLKTVAVKKSAKKLVLQASLGKVNGKYLNKKTVTFKFNGKKYIAKTNSKGVAKYTLKSGVLKKLKVGKMITYQATYLKDTVKKTAKVKK